MLVRLLGIVGLGLALVTSACGGGPCGGQTCSASQRCTATQVCVTDEAPTISLELPTDNQAVTTGAVMVKGTANDDTAVAQLLLEIEGAPAVTVAFSGSGAFLSQVPVPALDGKTVTLTATAIDPKNQKTKVTRTLLVDNVAPACTVTIAPVVTATGDVVVATSVVDGSGAVTNARLSTDGAATFSPVTGNAFTWTLSSENGVMHELVFRADDATGHVCEAKTQVLVDNVKPVVGFTTPDAGAVLGATGGLFSGPANDGARALKSVTVAFADAGPQLAALANGQWSIALTGPGTDDFAPETATVTATDLADNTASATLGVTVDVVAPVVTVTSPAKNAMLNIASFPSGDDVTVIFSVIDGDAQATGVLLGADGGALPAAKMKTSATDNPKAYNGTVRATDRAGNVATALVAFSVDRVAPTLVSSVPTNNTRMHVGPVSADFNEPMAPGVEGLTLTPDAGGMWSTPTKWTSGALAKDTVYAATAGGTDVYGNPASGTFKFHTETWLPDAGATLISPVAGVDYATADQEGAMSFLVHNAADAGFWLIVSPRTGQIQTIPLSPTNGKLMNAWRTVKPDLSSRRVVGLTLAGSGIQEVVYALDGVTVVGPNDEAFISTPAFPGEGTGLGEFGTIRRNGAALEYVRSGRPALPLDVTQVDGIGVSGSRWELFQHGIVAINSQTYGCFPNVISGAPPICELRAVDTVPATLGSSPRVEAMSTYCSVVSPGISQMTTYFNPWQPDCGNFGRPACVPKSTATAAARELVSDLSTDGTFYSVEGVGPYQVRKLVMGGGCVGSWANVGTPVTLATKPALVVIRGNPMLVYADGNGNLKLAAP